MARATERAYTAAYRSESDPNEIRERYFFFLHPPSAPSLGRQGMIDHVIIESSINHGTIEMVHTGAVC